VLCCAVLCCAVLCCSAAQRYGKIRYGARVLGICFQEVLHNSAKDDFIQSGAKVKRIFVLAKSFFEVGGMRYEV
jgi:hypothetical protein